MKRMIGRVAAVSAIVVGMLVGTTGTAAAVTCGKKAIQDVTYTSTSLSGTQTSLTNLRGYIDQGDLVTVSFRIKDGCPGTEASLVSYEAQEWYFKASTAHEQEIYEQSTGTFDPGTHSMVVPVPNCYFQVDFAWGAPIETLGYASNGGQGFYGSRLISADNGDKEGDECGELDVNTPPVVDPPPVPVGIPGGLPPVDPPVDPPVNDPTPGPLEEETCLPIGPGGQVICIPNPVAQ